MVTHFARFLRKNNTNDFSLRKTETYLSVTKVSPPKPGFCDAYEYLKAKLELKDNSSIGLVEQEETLRSINTREDGKKVIDFRNEGDPHFGIYFITDDPMEILEAKSTLLFLFAKNKLQVKEIKKLC